MKYKNNFFEIYSDNYEIYSNFTDNVWKEILDCSDDLYPELGEYNRNIQSFIYDNIFYNSDFTEKVLKHIQEDEYPCIDSMVIKKIKQIKNINDIVLSFLENLFYYGGNKDKDKFHQIFQYDFSTFAQNNKDNGQSYIL